MTRKLTNKQIVGEAMFSVRHSLTANIPPPPANPDGTFKTVDQMVNETRERDWLKRKAQEEEYQAAVDRHDAELRNDPEQVAWEREQRRHAPKEKRKLPFLLKVFFALIAFMLAGLTGNDIVLYIVGVGIAAWIIL